LVNKFHEVEGFGQKKDNSKGLQIPLSLDRGASILQDKLVGNGVEDIENDIKPRVNSEQVLLAHECEHLDHDADHKEG
jgi:hypothetical protein